MLSFASSVLNEFPGTFTRFCPGHSNLFAYIPSLQPPHHSQGPASTLTLASSDTSLARARVPYLTQFPMQVGSCHRFE
jgi:hypothetical protein